jgi:hypothetical protein
MTFWQIYPAVVAGIVISIIYPILRQALPQPKAGVAGVQAVLPRVWSATKPYIATLALALITAPLIMAFLGAKLDSWPAALLAGFAWQATLDKAIKG